MGAFLFRAGSCLLKSGSSRLDSAMLVFALRLAFSSQLCFLRYRRLGCSPMKISRGPPTAATPSVLSFIPGQSKLYTATMLSTTPKEALSHHGSCHFGLGLLVHMSTRCQVRARPTVTFPRRAISGFRSPFIEQPFHLFGFINTTLLCTRQRTQEPGHTRSGWETSGIHSCVPKTSRSEKRKHTESYR